MRLFKKVMSQVLCMALMSVWGGAVKAQQPTGNLRGQVTDELGGAIGGATVTLIDANNVEKTVTTSDQGSFVFNGMAQGKYFLRVIANGFALYEKESVEIGPGRREVLNIKMTVTIEKQRVTVTSDSASLSNEADNNAGAVVLKGKDLDALPDDPDDLAAALQAMAGPSAGPNGGQLYIDGFTGGTMPPKDAIREIRINQNPFAAENDRIGFGRIEILTKPGADKYHGSAFFNFNNQDFNSRNPFVTNKPAFLYRTYGGSINGPIIPKRATFFVNFFRRDIDDNAIVNATVLDSSLNKVTFSEAIVAPIRRTEISPRFDYQLTKNNTLVARYSYEHNSFQNQGVGGFSLPSTAFNMLNTENSLRLTETAVLSSAVINETRFQFLRTTADRMGDNSTPTIQVGGAFTGGGSNVGLSSNVTHRWEVQNYTTWSTGKHTFKFGGRFRRVTLNDVSFSNFGGTFSFFGDPRDLTVQTIDVYRRTLLGQQQGLTPAQIVAMGGGPSQFTITVGSPAAGIRQLDAGIFAQDDWKVRPDLTLSLGLRFEGQDHLADKHDIAPRVAFAWSPGASANAAPKTVIRGGSGIFYERFSENLTLQASRLNGIEEQQFILTDRLILATVFPKVPSIATLESSATPQNIFRVAGNLTAPYTIQSSISIEQQLPHRFTLTATYINARGLHYLRSRNINAPLPGTFDPNAPPDPKMPCRGVRPFGFVDGVCNIFEYESSGVFKQNQLVVNLSNRFNKYFTVQGFYVFGKTESDTDSAGGFPANSFDLRGEFSRTSFDARHRGFVFGNINLPHQVSLSPFVIVSSGLPFNITTGIDSNGDSLTTDRPAFATSSSTKIKVTRFGTFDLNPLQSGLPIIPRNFGQGPGSFTVNLRVGKTFGFGRSAANVQAANQQRGGAGGGQMVIRGAGAPGGGGHGGPGGGPERSGMFGGGGGGSDRPYTVTVSVFVTNLLNHVNPSSPVGNLSSPFFGQSLSLAGGGFGGFGGGGSAMNRRIEMQVRFNF